MVPISVLVTLAVITVIAAHIYCTYINPNTPLSRTKTTVWFFWCGVIGMAIVDYFVLMTILITITFITLFLLLKYKPGVLDYISKKMIEF